MTTSALPTLALAGAAALAQLQAATTENPLNRRDLSGGARVTASTAPFLVFLETNYGRYYGGCLGTLISNSWIVTAAHCIDATGGRQIIVRHISGYEDRKFARPPDRADETRHITIHVHPAYEPAPPDSWEDVGTDIALLRLPRPFQGSSIAPVRLPTAAEALTIQPGLTVRTIGKTGRRSAASADWPIWTKPHASAITIRTDPGSRFLELGDSGGPTLMQVGSEWVLIGLNRGADTEGQRSYDAVNISYHREWMAALGVDGIEPPGSQPPAPPSTPEPRPQGKITLTLETENLTGLTCAFETSGGASTRISGSNSRSSISWNLTCPFRRSITIECE
ncbi:MAG: trypsin-like serine protease [Bryobacterales bacterium]|nr:trypsin-like serine protease [Bryobacterales bacterium]